MDDNELSEKEKALADAIYQKVDELNHALKSAALHKVTARVIAEKDNGVDVGLLGDVISFKVMVGGLNDGFWRVIQEQ